MPPQLPLILICLALGLALRRTGRFPANSARAFNGFVIWVSLPAVVLLQIPRLLESTSWNWDLLIPVSMAWILLSLSILVFTALGKMLGWTRAETGALVLTAGLGNTSFVGLPLLESMLGPSSTPIALLVDQPGTFLALSTLGVLYASSASPAGRKRVSAGRIMRNVFGFPPFLSLLAAVALWIFGLNHHQAWNFTLEKLGATLVPVALVAVGFQLNLSASLLQKKWPSLSMGLAFKLFLAPLFFLTLFIFLIGSRSFSTHVTILESAMAPMITAGIVADEFGFDAEISGLMIGLGIPLSLLTVHFWELLLRLT